MLVCRLGQHIPDAWGSLRETSMSVQLHVSLSQEREAADLFVRERELAFGDASAGRPIEPPLVRAR